MLSEITDGNTRAQILAALKANDIESLRKNVSALWQSNYANDPSFTSLLANSLWLNSDVKYKEETLKRLAGDYFISSFAALPVPRILIKPCGSGLTRIPEVCSRNTLKTCL